MHNHLSRRALAILAGAVVVSCNEAPTAVRAKLTPDPVPSFDVVGSPHVVISQVYGGNGNTYRNDFVELYNAGTAAQSLSGWSIQYASATGTGNFAGNGIALLSGTIQPGQYYLVAQAAGSTGAALPTPDASGTVNMSASAGKVALVSSTTGLACNGGSTACSSAQMAQIIDLVGYGTANFYLGAAAPALSNTTAGLRADGGRQDTRNNAADFSAGAPNPRNSASPTLTPKSGLTATISPSSPGVQLGNTVSFSATAAYFGAPVAITSATWTSSDPTVATIDASTGVATPVALGTTTIGISASTANGTATASTTLTVSVEAAAVAVSPSTWSFKVGQSKTFSASAQDINGNPVVTSFTWTSTDPTIAKVDASGLVTALAVGGATIRATSANGKVGEAAVTVSNVSVSSRTVPLPVGFQTQVFASGTDASGNPVASVTWSTTNANVLTVDEHGVVTATGVGSASVIATTPDNSTGATTITTESQAFSSTARTGHNTEFGVPADRDASDDIIITRKQYTLSYNPRRGGANWVSWDLSTTHLGGVDRCNCYSTDTALTRLGITAYNTNDWISGGQYDRGHMEPSADQTTTDTENGSTYFLTNFLPQRHDLNAGPWEKLEIALRDSAKAGREVYQIAGGIFTNGVGLGSLNDAGRIWIPDSTWKVAVLMPAGKGLADVTSPADIDVIAVNMPNVSGIANDGWAMYVTTVDAIQRSTGYDLLSALPEPIQCLVEARNCAPIARLTSALSAAGWQANEGDVATFSGSTSSDPNAGDVLTYAWTVNDASAGSDATLSYTFPNNGSYVVRLIVADNHGAADTSSATVTVLDVAPAIGALPAATLLRGETYAATGSFTDPGADIWAATVNYGDGAGAQPLALSGKSFSLAHTYAAAGTFTLAVAVNDGDLTSTASTTVVVKTAQAGISDLEVVVASLRSLNGGQRNALDASLRAAADALTRDNATAAVNQLSAFVSKLEAHRNSGDLADAVVDPIIAYAQRVIASVQAP